MTNGTPQHQAHSGPGAPPHRPGPPVDDFTASISPSSSSAGASTAESSDGNVQNRPLPTHVVVPERRDSIVSVQGPDPRPPLGSREFSSADLVDEIRRVVRQEFLGAYTLGDHSRKPVSDDGSVSPTSGDVGNTRQGERLSRPKATVEDGSDSDEESCSPTTVPVSASDRTTTRSPTPTPPPSLSPVSAPPPPLPSPTATKPGVRFSDSVTLVEHPPPPPRRASWAMYRRASSSSGEPVPEWGVLFDGNGFATPRCAQVLRGLARCLAEEFPPRGAVVVTPEKLGLLYSRFRIEGEVYPFEDIFHALPRRESSISPGGGGGSSRLATYHKRISDFFTDLDLEYYLVPPSALSAPLEADFLARSPSSLSVSSASPSSPAFARPSSSYTGLQLIANPAPSPNQYHQPLRPRPRSARPSVPALTLDGFVQFFTRCVLAHPDEEAKRLNKIVNELALVADVGPNYSAPSAPSAPSTSSIASSPTQGPPSPSTSFPGLVSGGFAGRGERLPRQFVRSLLPVKPDPKSRKLLEAAVDDLLCDLDLSGSPASPSAGQRSLIQVPASSAPALHFAEPNRRWSFANVPADSESNFIPGWGSQVPRLPPPPVPLPRSASGSVSVGGGMGRGGNSPSASRQLPSSSSTGTLAGLQSAPPRGDGAGSDPSSMALVSHNRSSYRQHHPRHSYDGQHRRYPAEVVIQPHGPQSRSSHGTSSSSAMVLRSKDRATRFELGDGDDDSGSSGTASTAATISARPARTDRRSSYHGHEYDRDRDRERERARDKDRDRDRERERRYRNRGREYDDRERERERDRERDKERDRHRDRDRDRDRERDRERERERNPERNRSYERRPPPQFNDRRRSSAIAVPTISSTAAPAPSSPTATRANSISNTTAPRDRDRDSGALVVAHQHDDRGPTWSEVLRPQQQQPLEQPQAQQQPQQKVKSVSFYDERERTYAP
ncbi:hypothetical protein F5Y10DRAFT_284055 [Nemania abortiva]|nr:hypothetical protein F5Y10DRAFT_284055 [Nemania abortiva]